MVQTFGTSDYEPVPGAIVQLTRAIGPGDEPRAATSGPVASSETDSSGSATMAVSKGRYVVTVSADGYQREQRDVTIAAGDVAVGFFWRLAPPELVPQEASSIVPRGAVSGSVLTLEGEPVANARVELWARGYSQDSAVTTTDGSFRVIVRMASPETYTVKIRPSHMPSPSTPAVTHIPDVTEYPVMVPVLPNHETPGVEIRVRTHPEFRLRVTVSDGTGRVPSGARVTISRPGMTISRLMVNPDGIATSGPLPPGPVTVVAIADGTPSRLAAIARGEIQDRSRHILLELLPGARMTGRVEFADRQRPLHSQWPLRLYTSVPGHSPPGSSDADSNGLVESDGSFVLDGLVGDRCLHLTGIPGGWRLSSVTHQDRDVTGVPMTFELGQDVSDVVFRLVPGDETPDSPLTCGSQ